MADVMYHVTKKEKGTNYVKFKIKKNSRSPLTEELGLLTAGYWRICWTVGVLEERLVPYIRTQGDLKVNTGLEWRVVGVPD